MVIKNSRPPGAAQTGSASTALDTAGAEKPRQQSQRSASENKERAYIAASRRSDRSIDARVQSARMASVIHKDRTGKSLRITEDIVLKEEMYEEEDDMPSHARRYWKDSDLPAKFRDFATVQAAMHLSVTNPAILHTDANRVEQEFERVFGSRFRSPSSAAFALPCNVSQATRSPHPLQVDTQLAQQGISASSPSAMSPRVSSATTGSPGFPFGAAQPNIASPLATPNAMYSQLSPRTLDSRSHSIASDMGSTPLSRSSPRPLGPAQQGRRRSRDEFAGLGSTHPTQLPSTGSVPTVLPPSKRRRSDFAALNSTTTTPTRDHFTSHLPQNVQDMFASTWMNNTQWQHQEPVWDSVELTQEPLALQSPPPPKNRRQSSMMSHAPITVNQFLGSDRSRSSSLAPSTNYSLSNQPVSPTAPGAGMAYTMLTTESAHAASTPSENLSLNEIAHGDFTYWDSVSATDFGGDFNIDEFLNMSQSQDNDNSNTSPTWFA